MSPHTSDSEDDSTTSETPVLTYLQEKKRNIARNKATLKKMGLLAPFSELVGVEGGKESKKQAQRKKKKGPIRCVSFVVDWDWLSHLL